MSPKKVLVFGATGQVGGAAALEAHNRGAEVYLALRDIKKTTKNLPEGLARLQADLTDAESVTRAVQESGAESVFIYSIDGQDMAPVAESLKKTKIKHVVLLSSYTIYPSREEAINGDAISASHARAEQNFIDAGIKTTFLRPMHFTSNIWYSSHEIKQGVVPVYQLEKVDDYIAPEDIGAVAGVKLLSENAETIPITGPKLISRRDAWKIVGEELGRDLRVEESSRDDHIAVYEKLGAPRSLGEALADIDEWTTERQYPAALLEEATGNVKKYTGRTPIGLREWVRKHKDELH